MQNPPPVVEVDRCKVITVLHFRRHQSECIDLFHPVQLLGLVVGPPRNMVDCAGTRTADRYVRMQNIDGIAELAFRCIAVHRLGAFRNR